jgi:hypothetical protein
MPQASRGGGWLNDLPLGVHPRGHGVDPAFLAGETRCGNEMALCRSRRRGNGGRETGRKAFLVELDPLYADVIVQRFEQFTGKKAERQTA